MATFYQTFTTETTEPKLYTSIVAEAKKEALSKFKALFHQSAFLHLSFLLFICIQLIVTTCLFISDLGSFYAPTSLAILFLAITSYALIAFYQKNRKLDAIDNICKEFHRACATKLQKHIQDSLKLRLANAACLKELTEALHSQELFYLNIPPFNFSNNHLLAHILYFHYSDILYLQEKLLDLALKEHSYILADAACDLEFHTSLSKTYAALAKCYKRPSGKHLQKAYDLSNLSKKAELSTCLEKYYTLAVEELQIVKELSENESWAILDLATLYRSFDETKKEMEEYEHLLGKTSDDKEILYRLGLLYFMHHKTSSGLKIYHKLRKLDALFAKNLLSHYHF